ncbi:EpsG family protein [Aeromonas hydrophila]|uniref:EpsG family protein n=1 Tax=Aeromonas hydrophila TaxID=644 RepID=UPI0038D09E5A
MFNINLVDALILSVLCVLCFLYFSVRVRFLDFLILASILFISVSIVGFRSNEAGFDTHIYVEGYKIAKSSIGIFDVSDDIKTKLGIGSDIGFWAVAYTIGLFQLSDGAFLYLNALLSIFILFFGLYKIFGRNAVFYLFAFVVCGTFYNTFGNAIRQAYVVSLMPLVMYYRYLLFSKTKLLLVLLIMSTFHKGASIVVFAFLLLSFIRLKHLYVLYALSPLISVFFGSALSKLAGGDIYSSSSGAYYNPFFIILNITLVISGFYYHKVKKKMRGGAGSDSNMLYVLHISLLIMSLLCVIFSFNEFAYNRVANFAYLIQSIVILFYIRFLSSDKSLVSGVALIFILIWGLLILNTSSVQIILYA